MRYQRKKRRRGWSDESGPVTSAIRRGDFVNVLKGLPACAPARGEGSLPVGTRPLGAPAPRPLPGTAELCRPPQATLAPRGPLKPIFPDASVTAGHGGPRPHCHPGRHPAPASHVRLRQHDLTGQQHAATTGANQKASAVTVLMTPDSYVRIPDTSRLRTVRITGGPPHQPRTPRVL